jgi:hypothetical protein
VGTMGRPHEETHASQWRTHVAPDVVWEYILDADAQVRHDSRIEAIVLESGAWGAPGSVMAMTGVDAEGTSHTVRVKLEASVPPHFYRTREETPDVTVVTTVRTEAEGRGTLVSTVIDVTTRRLNWLERIAVKRGHASREAENARAAVEAKRAVEAFAADRGRPLPEAQPED